MDPEQHGSRQKRSCLSQLLEHHDEILKMLESGGNVDVIYTDFEKAFEKNDHETLLKKMENKFGIKGKILKWFRSFLKNRKQQVIDFNKFLNTWDQKQNIVFVTHYVVISELLNYAPSSGEIVISDKNLKVIDTFEIEY